MFIPVEYSLSLVLKISSRKNRLKTIDQESQSFPIVFLNCVYMIENDWLFAVFNNGAPTPMVVVGDLHRLLTNAPPAKRLLSLIDFASAVMISRMR